MKLIKRKWLIVILIIVIIAVLNPGINRFKEYSGLIGTNSHSIKRPYNFLICSIYLDTRTDKKYLGLLLNFIDITPPQNHNSDDEPKDSVENKVIIYQLGRRSFKCQTDMPHRN